MENVTITETILAKKLDRYNHNSDDFIAGGEITVTITLSEYRALVASKATKKADIDKANEDKYERDNENKTLREEVARLKAELYELKSTLDDSKEEK